MNSCSFLGRMGKEPKFFAGNDTKKSLIQFSLAVKKAFAPQGQPDTNWFDFKAYGKTADLINQYVQTGRQLGVVCHADVEEWTEQGTNAKRRRTCFIVDNITFCDGKDGAGAGGSSASSNTSSNSSQGFVPVEDEDDDLPF